MSDDRDPILDACLEELLGGQSPPDLTPRIMQAWSKLPPALPAAPPVQGSDRVDRPVGQPPGHSVRVSSSVTPATGSRSAARRKSRFAMRLMAAASVAAIGLGIGFALLPPAQPVAPPTQVAGNSQPQANQPQAPAASPQNEVAGTLESESPRKRVPEVVTPKFVAEPPFATDRDRPPFEFTAAAPPVPALEDADVVTAIDTAIRAAWQANEISPAPRAADDAFADRLFRQLLGRGPTAAELQSFAAIRAKDKRAQLVDDLLTREENVVEFARHWSDVWTDGLIGRTESSWASQANREGLQQFLRRSIQQAKPWDEVAIELLTASGSGEAGSPQYNGAANFLLTHYDGKATRATAQVARAFLGQRLQCAQCHDHPVAPSLVQNRFWELNTFLRQVGVQRGAATNNAAANLLVSRDFLGDGGGNGLDAEVFYETPRGELKVAYPDLPGVSGVPRSGLVDEFDRRACLAEYVASSQSFRRAVVNRVWSAVFGFGFTSPVDDLGPHNPPSHPQLLNDLADQFAAHNHNLRTLIRWMVLSEPFQLGSGPVGDIADAPELGRDRWFSRSYPPAPATTAPQESLVALAKAISSGKTELGIGTTANIKPAFPAPGRLRTGDQPNAPLVVAVQPGAQVANVVPATIDRILEGAMSGEEKLEHLFLVALQRPPTRREQALAVEIASGDIDEADRTALLRIWWAIDRGRE